MAIPAEPGEHVRGNVHGVEIVSTRRKIGDGEVTIGTGACAEAGALDLPLTTVIAQLGRLHLPIRHRVAVLIGEASGDGPLLGDSDDEIFQFLTRG